jgi:excisionase family DNA binding protein
VVAGAANLQTVWTGRYETKAGVLILLFEDSAMRLITQQQTAQMLHCTTRTVRNLISRGVLTGYQLPGFRAIRLDADEVRNKIKTIPTAIKPFGPNARIVQAPADAVIEIDAISVAEGTGMGSG